MNKEKLSVWAYITVAVLASVVLGYFGIVYILPILLPFGLAWGIAFAIRPACSFLEAKTGMPRKFLRATVAVLLIITVLGAVVFVVAKGATEAWQLLIGIGEDEKLLAVITKILNPLDGIFGDSESAAELEEKIAEAVSSIVSSLLGGVGKILTSVVGALPKIFIFLVITVISTVYFSCDLERINSRVRSVLPQKIEKHIIDFKNNTFSFILKYIRSYALIMLITFFVMLLGLSLLKVNYALLLAVIIAVLDVLPVIGVGTVLVPWSLWCFVTSNTYVAIGLIVLFVVNETVRQFVEPRIVGKNLGLHPLITLALLYSGYTLFGIVGIILVPILAAVTDSVFVKNKPS